MHINPYLFFDGRCEEAFEFYAKVLGGKIIAMLPHEGTPAEGHVPAEWRSKIMHARLEIGDQALMASDAPPQYQEAAKGSYVSLHYTDPADAERVFNGLAEGGTIRMAMEETFWAARFGMLVDRFGTPWMVNCDKPAG